MKSIHAALENLRAAQAKAKAENRTNGAAAKVPAPLPSRDWVTAKTEEAPSNEFEIWREAWSRQILEDRQLSQRGKIVCWAIALRVNRTKRTAWPAGRLLDKETGMSRNTVMRGLDDAAARGHLRIQPPAGRRRYNIYTLILHGRSAAKTAPKLRHHGLPGCTSMAYPGEPEPLNEPLNEPLIQYASHTASAKPMNSNEEKERGRPGGAVGNPEVPLDDIPGGEVALDALLSRGAGMSLGGLKNYAAAHGEELDAAAFISSGAVFRVGELVFPVGCKRVGHREFCMPDDEGASCRQTTGEIR